MLLSARVLRDVANVNSFDYADAFQFTEGDATVLYIQLCDMTVETAKEGFSPPGRRYMPAVAATLSVIIENIDTAKKITRSATQPFSQDASIWSIPILATDAIRGTSNLRLVLTESGVVTRGTVKNAISVQGQDC